MRNSLAVELAIIRNHRPSVLRLLLWLFPRSFNAFASAHLCRAYEKGEINSHALHSISHYVGADCGLHGYGTSGKR